MAYKINKHYFDIIDTEEKAYWLGFLWCDGYVAKRIRNNGKKIEYNIKLSLAPIDEGHLVKFKDSLNSTHPIKNYEVSGFGKKSMESRVFITNMHMGRVLQEEYGLIPHRHDCSKLVNSIPLELRKHFIRGVFDADGSFSDYYHTNKSTGTKYYKLGVQFSTFENLLEYIEQYFYEVGISETREYSKYKRHKGEHRDGHCRTIVYSGRIQGVNVLRHLYEGASIYLDRSYQKYLGVLERSEK